MAAGTDFLNRDWFCGESKGGVNGHRAGEVGGGLSVHFGWEPVPLWPVASSSGNRGGRGGCLEGGPWGVWEETA